MKRRELIYIIAILLLILGCTVLWNLLSDSSKETSDKDLKHLADQARYKRDKVVSDSLLDLRDKRIAADSAKHLTVQGQLKTEIKSLKRRERLSRVDTVTQTIVDTVYLTYDKTIKDLENERDTIRLNKNAAITILKGKVFKADSAYTASDSLYTGTLIKLENEQDKQFGIGAQLGVDQSGRPSLSVGVQWQPRKLRFSLKRKH